MRAWPCRPPRPASLFKRYSLVFERRVSHNLTHVLLIQHATSLHALPVGRSCDPQGAAVTDAPAVACLANVLPRCEGFKRIAQVQPPPAGRDRITLPARHDTRHVIAPSNPQLLTSFLSEAKSVSLLQTLHSRHAHTFDAIHVAAMAYRLAQLAKSGNDRTGGGSSSSSSSPTITTTTSGSRQRSDDMHQGSTDSNRQATISHASLLSLLLSDVARLASVMDAEQAISVLWACASLAVHPPWVAVHLPLLRSVASWAGTSQWPGSPSQLCMAVWSIAKLDAGIHTSQKLALDEEDEDDNTSSNAAPYTRDSDISHNNSKESAPLSTPASHATASSQSVDHKSSTSTSSASSGSSAAGVGLTQQDELASTTTAVNSPTSSDGAVASAGAGHVPGHGAVMPAAVAVTGTVPSELSPLSLHGGSVSSASSLPSHAALMSSLSSSHCAQQADGSDYSNSGGSSSSNSSSSNGHAHVLPISPSPSASVHRPAPPTGAPWPVAPTYTSRSAAVSSPSLFEMLDMRILWAELGRHVHAHAAAMGARESSNCLYALALARRYDGRVFYGLLQSLQLRLRTCKPQDLSNALWAVATVQHGDVGFLQAACHRLDDDSFLASMKPLQAMHALWALAKLRWLHTVPPELAARLRAGLPRLLKARDPLGDSAVLLQGDAAAAPSGGGGGPTRRGPPARKLTAEVLWSAMQLGLLDEGVLGQVAPVLVESAGVMSARDLAIVAWSCSEALYRSSGGGGGGGGGTGTAPPDSHYRGSGSSMLPPIWGHDAADVYTGSAVSSGAVSVAADARWAAPLWTALTARALVLPADGFSDLGLGLTLWAFAKAFAASSQPRRRSGGGVGRTAVPQHAMEAVLQHLGRAALDRVHHFAPSVISLVTWALTTVTRTLASARPPAQLRYAEVEQSGVGPAGSPSRSPLIAALLPGICTSVRCDLHGFTASELANVTWGLAELLRHYGQDDYALFDDVSWHMLRRRRRGPPPPAAPSTGPSGFALAVSSDPPSANDEDQASSAGEGGMGGSGRGMPLLHSLKPIELGKLAWAYARTGQVHESLFEQLASCAMSNLADFRAPGAVMVLWSFAMLGCHEDQELLTAMGDVVVRHMADLLPQDVAAVLWAAATAQVIQDGELVRGCLARAADMTDAFTSPELAQVAWAASAYKRPCPTVAAALCRRLQVDLKAFSPSDVALALTALADLRVADERALSSVAVWLLQQHPGDGRQTSGSTNDASSSNPDCSHGDGDDVDSNSFPTQWTGWQDTGVATGRSGGGGSAESAAGGTDGRTASRGAGRTASGVPLALGCFDAASLAAVAYAFAFLDHPCCRDLLPALAERLLDHQETSDLPTEDLIKVAWAFSVNFDDTSGGGGGSGIVQAAASGSSSSGSSSVERCHSGGASMAHTAALLHLVAGLLRAEAPNLLTAAELTLLCQAHGAAADWAMSCGTDTPLPLPLRLVFAAIKAWTAGQGGGRRRLLTDLSSAAAQLSGGTAVSCTRTLDNLVPIDVAFGPLLDLHVHPSSFAAVAAGSARSRTAKGSSTGGTGDGGGSSSIASHADQRLPSASAAIAVGGQAAVHRTAVLLAGPDAYCSGSGRVTGFWRCWVRLLNARGWQVVVLPLEDARKHAQHPGALSDFLLQAMADDAVLMDVDP